MEYPLRFRPCSHHRHHLCQHHRHYHHHGHHPRCHHHHHHYQLCSVHHHSNCHFLPVPLQDPLPISFDPSRNDFKLQPNFYKETPASVVQVSGEPEQDEVDEEDYEEGEPVFVLSDEWREFFAKSEAKRKLEKQQAKKKNRSQKGKN